MGSAVLKAHGSGADQVNGEGGCGEGVRPEIGVMGSAWGWGSVEQDASLRLEPPELAISLRWAYICSALTTPRLLSRSPRR